MEKSKLYTRTGDQGHTSLVGGTRVSKTHVRLEAYGTVDELNACLGYLIAQLSEDEEERHRLQGIQHRLFALGAYLATDTDTVALSEAIRISDDSIIGLEQAIDRLDASVPPLTAFVLPGGSPDACICHICRTVCRRAERRILSLEEIEGIVIEKNVKRYINRLSDYLFVLSRKLNKLSKNEEIKWDKSCR